MSRRDTSPEAVAREWWGNHAGEEWHTVDALASVIRAERARVRRIVRGIRERCETQTGRNACDMTLAALREGKGTR